jgi:hypothetical protein
MSLYEKAYIDLTEYNYVMINPLSGGMEGFETIAELEDYLLDSNYILELFTYAKDLNLAGDHSEWVEGIIYENTAKLKYKKVLPNKSLKKLVKNASYSRAMQDYKEYRRLYKEFNGIDPEDLLDSE